MLRPVRAHYRNVNHSFCDALLDGLAMVTMGPAGLDESDPPLYPRDAQARDLERIGGDMYAAFEAFGQESRRANAKAAPGQCPRPPLRVRSSRPPK